MYRAVVDCNPIICIIETLREGLTAMMLENYIVRKFCIQSHIKSNCNVDS